MKKIRFDLQIFCTVGWNDEEDTATLGVGNFGEVVEVITVLQKINKSRRSKIDEKIRSAYNDIKDSLTSKSGEEIMTVGEVIGIQCSYEDDMGIRGEMALNDNFGIVGSVRVNTSEHENEYKRLLAEAKKLATSIMKL